MRRPPYNVVLTYQCVREARREAKERLWTGLADLLAYSIVWGAVGAAVVALLGSVLLWGVLLVTAAH